MTRGELRRILEVEGFREDSKAVTCPNVTFLKPAVSAVEASTIQRGLKTGLKNFRLETDARMFLLAQLRGDPSARRSWADAMTSDELDPLHLAFRKLCDQGQTFDPLQRR
jgi:hypothetical protein